MIHIKQKAAVVLGMLICFSTLTTLFAQKIELPVRKDAVIAMNLRATILTVGEGYLDEEHQAEREAFVERISPIQNPFTKENELIVKTKAQSNEVSTPAVVKVVYDDSEILKVVSQSFTKQVRGVLSRGAIQYLQLQGGSLLKSGNTFPARIPQAEGQGTYTITLSDVSEDGYTLSLNDSSLSIIFDQGSGAVRTAE